MNWTQPKATFSLKYSRQLNDGTWLTLEASGEECFEPNKTTREKKMTEIAESVKLIIRQQYAEIQKGRTDGPRT